MRRALQVNALLSPLLLLAGCAMGGDSYKYEKPLVAVAPFEDRARFPLDWRLGEGVARILANSLFKTGHFRVLERGDIDEVLSEQELQATGRTRQEQRVTPDRLKNAHYIVTGIVTEFAHVAMAGVDIGVGSFRIGGGGNHAIVSLALKVVDVESGEVVYSRVVEGKTYAGEVELRATYKNIAFGGYSFFQTPLGRALSEALDSGVADIRDRLGKRLWRPVVSRVDGSRVLLTGGEDRRIRPASSWEVRRPGSPVVDPRSGDLLGREPGRKIGRVKVVRVADRYSIAVVEAGGGFEPGDILEPAEEAAPVGRKK